MAMPQPREAVVASAPVVTLGEWVRSVQRRLGDAGIVDAGREARWLVARVARVAPEAVIGRPEMPLDAACQAAIEVAVAKRIEGMPIGRIVGERAFYGREFLLNEATLEPRSDSETVIDAVLEVVAANGLAERPLRIVDVGTGTGCLLVTLLAELPLATGLGTDLAPRALVAAQANAERHGVAERADFVISDALEEVPGRFDILVSNPPYIRSDEIAGLDDEVRLHDPLLALDGGPDGLDVYRRIAGRLDSVVPQGWAFFEIGAGMRTGVCAVINDVTGPRVDWRVWHDLNGIERCVACQVLFPRVRE
jgi:release factor glutamine methyltransferase